MNSGSSSLKVTVNGKKYLITGIQKETSCKGLLCAIAKVTSQEQAAICKQNEPSRPNENLLDRFKGDRKLAGDITSLNVFNSLGRDAKIIAKETVTVHRELLIDDSIQVQNSSSSSKQSTNSSNTKKQRNKSKETKNKETKNGKEEKKEKKSKHKKKKETLTTTTTTYTKTETKVKQKIKHRSVDDSDIETYKRDRLRRMKNKRRVYDDSDIEIYKTLQNIVVDQNKKLTRMQKSSRDLKRTAWMRELRRNSQIYYIDDESMLIEKPLDKAPDVSAPVEEEDQTCVFDKDDGNDSGLPSPEYDSSESQENQPIKLKDGVLLRDKNNNDEGYQVTQKKSKQKTSMLKENNETTKPTKCNISPNNDKVSVKNYTNNKGEKNGSTAECISDVYTTNRLINQECFEEKNFSGSNTNEKVDSYNEGEIVATDNLKPDLEHRNDTFEMVKLNGIVNDIKEEKIIQHCNSTTTLGDNKSTLLLTEKHYKSIMIDKNKNFLKNSEACEREVSKMVAFNEALFKGSKSSTNNGVGKGKFDKKKVKKSDISDPVLLSPSTLKKHQSVRKVESVLGKQAADVLRKDVLKTIEGDSSTTLTKIEITKEKEKYFNKKLKEIRSKTSGKKSLKTKEDSKNEPEYFSKSHLEGEKQDNACLQLSTKKINQTNDMTDSSLDANQVINHQNNYNQESNHVSQFEDVRMKTIANSAELNNPSITEHKQNDMIYKPTTVETNETVLTADEILNEILEYERNIKNELDQIIQREEEEQEEKGEKEEKERNIELDNNKVLSSEDKLLDKQTHSQIETLQVEQSKHKNNIFNENSLLSHRTVDEDMIDKNVSSLMNPKIRQNDDEQERFELIEKYLEEKQALDEISEKLSEYSYALSRLQEDIALYDMDSFEQKTLDELDVEEQNVYQEIENVRSLLKSVSDLTSYQRKEMAENMELMDQMELEVRTQKANYENLRNGTWRNNSKSAPRSLIKHAKVKRRNSLLCAVDSAVDGDSGNKKPSSFV